MSFEVAYAYEAVHEMEWLAWPYVIIPREIR
jgi:hypothetical protein